jgi:O-antigen ligase/polysaccharide polymerase Wzy-like membrane protein
MRVKSTNLAPKGNHWPKVFAGLVGAWLGLSLLKFGNPIILDRLVEPPRGFWEFVFNSWPVAWGYAMLPVLLAASVPVVRFKTKVPLWVLALPLVWFGWQLLSATRTVDARLTTATVTHFTVCIVCFYLGLFALSRVEDMTLFWVFLLAGLVWVLWTGFGQHFGGLESTRRMIYAQEDWQQLPPEYLRRIASNRIFSTLVYPNALAGAILLLLPSLLGVTLHMTRQMTNIGRGVLVGLLAYAGVACLYWSGSKSGWLIGMALGLLVLLRVPFQRKVKVAIAATALAIGLAGFLVKFSDYFERGATSVGARFDYWRAAWETAKTHPCLGTGPGTFSISYRQLITPESEMTRLVHNDYLEQASDSGFPGFAAYLVFILGSMAFLFRNTDKSQLRFLVWLGLAGWALQGLVEFGLYIPALAWQAFLFLGWLWGTDAK